jgi:hypothetical protein
MTRDELEAIKGRIAKAWAQSWATRDLIALVAEVERLNKIRPPWETPTAVRSLLLRIRPLLDALSVSNLPGGKNVQDHCRVLADEIVTVLGHT